MIFHQMYSEPSMLAKLFNCQCAYQWFDFNRFIPFCALQFCALAVLSKFCCTRLCLSFDDFKHDFVQPYNFENSLPVSSCPRNTVCSVQCPPLLSPPELKQRLSGIRDVGVGFRNSTIEKRVT